MSSFDSSLGEETGIAEELAAEQRAISIAEFFEKNKHMLGFDSGARALVTAVKEGVDNSLDATEEAGIAPDIYVNIEDTGDYYRLVIEDNGPGITREQIPKVFGKLLYGSRFHKREQSLPPDQQVLVKHDGRVDFVPIGVLCDAFLPETGEATMPVPNDIDVPTFNRQTHETSWQPVTHVIRHNTAEQTYEIETACGRTLEVTGNHSLFAVTERGETRELRADQLEPGDEILAPHHLPEATETREQIDLLASVSAATLDDWGVMVHGVDRGAIEALIQEDCVVNSSSTDGWCYRIGDIQIEASMLENEYLPGGYLPASVVKGLEWDLHEHEVSLRRIGSTGEAVDTPASVPLDKAFMKAVGRYVATGTWHGNGVARTSDRDSVGDGRGTQQTVGTASVVERFVRAACTTAKGESQLPSFVFAAPRAAQQACIDELFEESSSGRTLDTGSEPLVRQVTTWLTMRGVTPDLERVTNGDQTVHRLTIPDAALAAVPDSDVCHLTVSDVRESTPPEYVYDISVPGQTGRDENFVVVNDGPIFVKNSRGQQGIGISAAVLYAQLTSGKPAKITSRTNGTGEAEYFEIVIDTESNEPEIRTESTTTWDRPHGTRLELEMEANLRARKQLHQYIKQTAVVNPHARVEMREPESSVKYERVTDTLPAETSEIHPHPHGVELGTVLKMLDATDSHSLSGFLQSEFTRVGRKTAEEIIAGFRDLHFGRELGWPGPKAHDEQSVTGAVIDATANKGKAPTKQFGEQIEAAVASRDRVTFSDLEKIVAAAAGEVESDHETRFGGTVQQHAVEAAWGAITANMATHLYRLVDEATTARKDDAVVEGLATRLAERIDDDDNPRQRYTRSSLTDLVDRAAEMTARREDVSIGETARDNIVEAIWTRMQTVTEDVPRVRSVAGDRDTANDLVSAMRAASIMAPPTDCLSPISAELIEAGLEKEYDADFYTATTRDGKVHAGDPFVVEAGIAYGGELSDDDSIEVLRFANRVPLVYQRGACATSDVVSSIGWRNYGLDQPGGSGVPVGPVVVMVHVASTNVPFTSESKDAVANVPEIEDEIELAVRDCARDLKSYLNKRRSLAQRREKADVLARILPQMATKVASVTSRSSPNIDDALARIMNNVLVERVVTDGTVSVTVHNHSDRVESLEVTEILDCEPTEVNGDVEIVEMDDEWYLLWEIEVPGGDTETVNYAIDTDHESSLSVDGIDEELVTVAQ